MSTRYDGKMAPGEYALAMSKAPAPSDLADKFMLRLPEGMRERIAEEAKSNGRSMNAEIVSRLQDTLDNGPIQAFNDSYIDKIATQTIKRLVAEFLSASVDISDVDRRNILNMIGMADKILNRQAQS